MVLPSSCLEIVRALTLAEGEAEGVERAHVEHRLQLHAVLEREGEDARRREAHVGLADIDELDRGGAVRRAGLHVDLDAQIVEIAQLLADPVPIVVEHFERAARRDPGELGIRRGGGATDAAQRGGGHDARGGDLQEGAAAHAARKFHIGHSNSPVVVPSHVPRIVPPRGAGRQASQLAHFFPSQEEEDVDENAEDREDQHHREELRHLDHGGIGGEAVAQAEAAADHLGADRRQQAEDRAHHQADEDHRQRHRRADLPEDLQRRGAIGAGQRDLAAVDAAEAGGGVDHHHRPEASATAMMRGS
jgi:hypothetical protein